MELRKFNRYRNTNVGRTEAHSFFFKDNLKISIKMYILRISPKAFIKQGQDREIIIVSNPDKATTFDKIGDAMKAASQINSDLGIHKVHVFTL